MRRWGRRHRLPRPEPRDPLEFVPTPVAEHSFKTEVERLVAGLEESTDEAVGHPLDNLINAWTDKWTAEIEAEHAGYLARVEHRLGMANAELGELDVVRERDRLRHDETTTARSSAVGRLASTEEPAAFGGPGFGDPTLLAGRPRSAFLHVVALVFAAGADISAFVQVVALLMPQQDLLTVGLLVVGLTAVTLYLAHTAGVLLRDRKTDVRWIRWLAPTLCLLVWAALGGLSTWARLIAPRRAELSLSFDPVTAPDQRFAIAGACVFLALYVGSGLAACLGAYLTHNRMFNGYRAATRAHDLASGLFAETARAHGVATALWQQQLGARDAAARILERERRHRMALGEELKQYARVLIAARGRDPALTDAILDPDRRPYTFEPSTNGTSGRTS